MIKRLLLALIVLTLVATIGGGGVWFRHQLHASLPQLDGERRIPGLTAPAVIARDDLGIPTIRGTTRADVARATGFLHAQDRFFQMDLARRRAAGELAELLGGRAIGLDRRIRLHRFRAVAQQAVRLLNPDDRAVLDAYVGGVNAGVRALSAPPFEYLLLRQTPQPWRAEDSLLVVLSMFITLQDSDGSYEAMRATLHDLLPEPMVRFLTPAGTEWDTPVVGPRFDMPPVPPPALFDQRTRRRGKPLPAAPRRPELVLSDAQHSVLGFGLSALGLGLSTLGFGFASLKPEAWSLEPSGREAAAVGSNNFAVAGRLTSNGGALLANDMHLNIRVPNTWYRAAFEWTNADQSGEPHRLFGVTLPGVPAMVAGSNTHIAWGFTNTYGDWSDIVLLQIDPSDPQRYRTPDGWRRFDRYNEVIHVAGQRDQHEAIEWTIWGPVLAPDHRGRPRALRWIAHSPEMLASTVIPVESATTIEEAFDAANGAGTPAQNVLVVDRSGRIGWTIYGTIPRRVGFDGTQPTSWADGQRGWQGWLDGAEYPRVIDPPDGRLWTANARVVGGDMLAKIGDGSFEVGSRARIIHDRLFARERFAARDLLDIQLDTQAVFLARWRDVILRTLTPAATAGNARRAEFRDVVQRDWSGGASAQSSGYRLTRAFRDRVSEWVFTFLLADCYEADEHFDYATERKREGPLWRLVTERPMHLLDDRFPSWDGLLLAAIDTVAHDVLRYPWEKLSNHPWSEANVVLYRHPLSAAIPFAGRWLDMPKHDLPGDLYTPRVAWGSIGASERMIVSPGREAEGIMHMPTGQSGHPLSPHYSDSHEAWAHGNATPFLPGRTIHRLRLIP